LASVRTGAGRGSAHTSSGSAVTCDPVGTSAVSGRAAAAAAEGTRGALRARRVVDEALTP
jgi:hypothetical protein